MARGVDEGDEPFHTVVLDGHLVGTDVLGDAAGFAFAHAGLPDSVEQSGLAVVDVTHDGDHRRTLLEVFLAALVLAIGQVEGFQQLAVLVLRGHDLHLVAQFGAEQLERSAATSLLKTAADKDDCADMVVTMCRTETMTGQTVVIDSGRVFH